MRWPWQRKTTAEREAAEQKAAQVRVEVILPLREMRGKDNLADAIIKDIRSRLKESGT